ncbi:MAG: hypothetical protein GY810_10125 [Aureispira sp.]|nr:hypothetical protein [Aureispira sp.]
MNLKKLFNYTLPLLLGAMSTNAQNVGIGTNTPTEKLHVNGGVRIANLAGTNSRLVQSDATGVLSNVADGTAGQVLTTDGAGTISWTNSTATAWGLLGNVGTSDATNFLGTTDAQDMVFKTNNVENMRINTNGNVDIGITSGIARLYTNIPNTDATTNYGIYNNHSGTDNGTLYNLYNLMNASGTGTKYGVYNNFANVNGTKNGVYNYFPNGTATGTIYGVRNNIYADGNATKYGTDTYIGGGQGTLYGSRNRIYPPSTNTSTLYGLYSFVNSPGTGTHYALYADAPGGTNDYAAVFYRGNIVANEQGGDYDFRVESDGNANMFFVDASTNRIGMGTNAPVEKFHIEGDRMLIRNGSDALYCSHNTATNYGFELIGSYPGFGVAVQRSIILGGYNINNPKGQGYDAANRVQCGGGGAATLPIYATSHVTTSSQKHKQNISALKYGLAEVLKIKPVTYQYKFDRSELYKVGFIAEQVSEVIPEVVAHWDAEGNEVTSDKGEAVGMDYSEMTAVLVNAVKEQQEMIKTMEATQAELKKQNEQLTEKLKAIEQQLNK